MNEQLYKLVVEAYQNAIENGYGMETLSDLEVAEDMCSYDYDIEDYPVEEVLECVKQFRKNNAGVA